jgi:hypothetical protein
MILCILAFIIISVYGLVHYHIFQYMTGRPKFDLGIASSIQLDVCAKLLRSEPTATLNVAADNVGSSEGLSTSPAEQYATSQNNSLGVSSGGDQGDCKDAARSAAVLDRLPQWFPPQAMESGVRHLNDGTISLVYMVLITYATLNR